MGYLAGVLAKLIVPGVKEGVVCQRAADAYRDVGSIVVREDGRCREGRECRRIVYIDG